MKLNEDECLWMDDNGIEREPLDFNEWLNQYPTTALLATDYLRLKGLLTKENRKEYRRIHGGRMLRLQEEADAGRIGGVIKNIVGRSPGFLMESLNHEGKTITDALTIAKLITAFFKNWFTRLPVEKERDSDLANCVLKQNKMEWDKLIERTKIPTSAADNLWIALQPRPISDWPEVSLLFFVFLVMISIFTLRCCCCC